MMFFLTAQSVIFHKNAPNASMSHIIALPDFASCVRTLSRVAFYARIRKPARNATLLLIIWIIFRINANCAHNLTQTAYSALTITCVPSA